MTTELSVEAESEVAETLDALIFAIQRETASARLLEHRAAALGGLLATSGPRYLARATEELEEALDAMHEASQMRHVAAALCAKALHLAEDAPLAEFALRAPEPYGSAITALRAELVIIRQRLCSLVETNTTALGQHLSLVSEALRLVGDEGATTYGRPTPTLARLVKGVL